MDKKTLRTFIKELHSPTNTRLYYTNIAIIVILFIVLFLDYRALSVLLFDCCLMLFVLCL